MTLHFGFHPGPREILVVPGRARTTAARALALALLALLEASAASQDAPAAATLSRPTPLGVPVPLPVAVPLDARTLVEKSFTVFALLESTPEVARLVREDADLARLTLAAKARLREAAASCDAEIACLTGALRFRPDEVARAAASLRKLYRANEAMRRLADRTMRESGLFELHRHCGGEELLARAVEEAVAGVNRIYDVYAEGRAPRYAPIDSGMFAADSRPYQRLLQAALGVMEETADDLDLWFQPSLRFAIRLLELNRRDEASRLEPLHLGENLEALSRVASTRWSDYPYSVILVPGSGPDRASLNLSPWGAIRLELAVRRFRAGKAPFLLVSGGYVYPAHAPFCEAIEMKKSLIADHGIPADAILVEPHARHTTTNLRNAARLLYRYGIPFERPVLVTTDRYHTDVIGGEPFAARCGRELGYVPFRLLRRLTSFDLEVVPQVESLHADAGDPLDP